jgi:hypothetical protein
LLVRDWVVNPGAAPSIHSFWTRSPESRPRAVAEPQDEAHPVHRHLGAEGDPVRQKAIERQSTIRLPGPFPGREADALAVPDRRDVGVGEVSKAEIREDGLGHIDDDVAAVGPRRKHADLGLALRVDGTVEKAEARVAAAGVGEHAQRVRGLAGCRGGVSRPNRRTA